MLHIITLDELSKAIEIRLHIKEETAKEYANIVMDFFGFDFKIIDNVLDQKERQLFYLLQSKGLLGTEREDILLYNGRRWRIHYWTLRISTILQNLQQQKGYGNRPNEDDQKEDIYKYLPKHLWKSRRISS